MLSMPFNPTMRATPMTGGMFAPMSPFAINMSPFAMNMGFGSTAMPNVYGRMASMTSAGYASPSYSSGYGNGYQNGNAVPASGTSTLYSQQGAEAIGLSTMLAAIGVPNDRGRVAWPVGLQVLSPTAENNELLQQIEGLVNVAASQHLSGQVSPRIVDETTRALGKLRGMLRNRKERMFSANYKEASSFIDKLDSDLKALK
jgi:hypothetical protein